MSVVAKHDEEMARGTAAQADSPTSGAVRLPAEELVPAHLLGGDEIVHLAIKPSPWFVPLTSLRWLVAGIVVVLLANSEWVPAGTRWYLYRAVFWLLLARFVWATLEWVSRLYILTNRRAMRIRGVFNVQLFECSLERIQNTRVEVPLPDRVTRVGTIVLYTAGGSGGQGGATSWDTVSRPLEVHQKLQEAIQKAQNRGSDGL